MLKDEKRSGSLTGLLISLSLCTITGGAAAVEAGESFGLGVTPTAEEVRRIDIDVMPDGRGLPEGSGSAAEGRVIYNSACAGCHGAEGQGGPNGSLAGAPLHKPEQLAGDKSLQRTVGNYWPYATSLFDYLRRAMPFDRPGSLQSDELYAITAYLLYLNDLIEEADVLDRDSLPRVRMPAQPYFRAARRQDGQ